MLNPTTQGDTPGQPWDSQGPGPPGVFLCERRWGAGSRSLEELPSGKRLTGPLQSHSETEKKGLGPWVSEVGK